ncbi:MAG TPA: hypothetical protein VFV90_01650, partial [Usitatibacter sp.]|nr:hypothetical protein [Usitatibacter sp.]
ARDRRQRSEHLARDERHGFAQYGTRALEVTMAHDKDHDHAPPPSPRAPRPLSERLRPDYKRREHPTSEPREPVDPRAHPSR